MYLPSALVAFFLLTLRASAFLIPPIPTPDKGNDVAITMVPQEEVSSVKSILAGLPNIVALDCPDCPFEEREGIENRIELQFEASVSTGLVINGASALSTAFDVPSLVSISAHQVNLKDGQVTAEQPLDFALEKLEPIMVEGTDRMLIPIRFTVLAIGGVPVKADTVALRLLRTQERSGSPQLVVLDTRLVPFEDTPGAEACDGDQGWGLCRVKAILMWRVKSMMKMMQHKDSVKNWVKNGCGGRFGGHSGPEGFGWKGGRPARFGHHHRHHGHRHERMPRFHQFLQRSIKFFLIPTLLGVVSGLLVSAVGMLVAQIVVHLWQKFYRGSSRVQTSTRVVEIVLDDEKLALMADEDVENAPPVYEDIEAVAVQEKH